MKCTLKTCRLITVTLLWKSLFSSRGGNFNKKVHYAHFRCRKALWSWIWIFQIFVISFDKVIVDIVTLAIYSNYQWLLLYMGVAVRGGGSKTTGRNFERSPCTVWWIKAKENKFSTFFNNCAIRPFPEAYKIWKFHIQIQIGPFHSKSAYSHFVLRLLPLASVSHKLNSWLICFSKRCGQSPIMNWIEKWSRQQKVRGLAGMDIA